MALFHKSCDRKNMKSHLVLVTAILVIASSAVSAEDAAANCPASIDVRQQLTAPVKGWNFMFDDAPHQLAGITFYEGPPQERASLVSDKASKAGGKETDTWYFKPQADRHFFVGCSYAGTSIVLTKELAAKTVSCAVTYSLQMQVAGLPVIEKVICK